MRYDLDGRLVVAGSIPGQYRVFVQRYQADGTLVSEYVRDGRWAHEIEVDDQCHVYVTGSDDGGAWVEKLW